MGSECCKGRPDSVPPTLPSKSRKTSRLTAQGKQLSQAFQTLLNNIQAPKGVGSSPQALWTLADLQTYREFLAALVQEIESMEQNPVIQLLGLPTEGLEGGEVEERCRAMQDFIAQLKGIHEPRKLPDVEWLEAVQHLVGKKTVFLACRKRCEQLYKEFQDFRASLGNTPNKHTLPYVEKTLVLQSQVEQTIDGYFAIIQQTERVFQAVSFLSRVALGMQARLDALSGRPSAPTDREEPAQASGLEMEIRGREQVEESAA